MWGAAKTLTMGPKRRAVGGVASPSTLPPRLNTDWEACVLGTGQKIPMQQDGGRLSRPLASVPLSWDQGPDGQGAQPSVVCLTNGGKGSTPALWSRLM